MYMTEVYLKEGALVTEILIEMSSFGFLFKLRTIG
jgi:hypothetical protein